MRDKTLKSCILATLHTTKKMLEPSKNTWSDAKKMKKLEKAYRICHDRDLNFDSPEYFTEKIQWYKIFYHNEELTRAVDKFLFKDYIKEKLGEGYTIPMYGAWSDVTKLRKEWETLPETFVLKSTLSSGGRSIKVIRNKSKENIDEIIREIREWLKLKNTLINSFCNAYYEATPRILAEAYVESVENQLFDYKIFCFSGVPFCTYVANEHFKGGIDPDDCPISFYDMDWKPLEVQYGKHPTFEIEKPNHYEEMISIAKKLSKDFPFVRVDFFDTDEKLYVAELTFYPGDLVTTYNPVSFDKKLGDLFILPK